MTPLLDALVDRILTMMPGPAGADRRLMRVIADQIVPMQETAVTVPMPTSPALVAVARRLLDSDEVPVASLARDAGMGIRTLERRFKAEIALSLRQFRLQVKLLRAAELLTAGHRVQDVAFRLGYENAGSFVQVFRKHMGQTPARYARRR
ncbi:helix-turn-helix domain-containing protein [Falsirhodobacter xinxiangensis]|uniref:helix-turn-helix domain-containing protein n=1 Tax=Falsirhodobacter xinxiangensis TaxID=2530049 RepID=UPI00145B125D|nr:helix-turn-helix domain-containing protein [Rhodobacter xinxiangensis]